MATLMAVVTVCGRQSLLKRPATVRSTDVRMPDGHLLLVLSVQPGRKEIQVQLAPLDRPGQLVLTPQFQDLPVTLVRKVPPVHKANRASKVTTALPDLPVPLVRPATSAQSASRVPKVRKAQAGPTVRLVHPVRRGQLDP